MDRRGFLSKCVDMAIAMVAPALEPIFHFWEDTETHFEREWAAMQKRLESRVPAVWGEPRMLAVYKHILAMERSKKHIFITVDGRINQELRMAGHHKGSNFERKMCKKLSLWWSNGTSDAVFWRAHGLGGWGKGRARKGQHTSGQHGDLAAIDRDGESLVELLTVEMKNGYSKHTFMDLCDRIDPRCIQKYEEWLHQVEESCVQSGSFSWLLLVQRNRRHQMVYMPRKLYNTFVSHGCFSVKPRPFLDIYLPDRRIVGMLLSTFLEQVSRRTIIDMNAKV